MFVPGEGKVRRQRQPAFGGDWTAEKLSRLHKYLRAYTIALSKQPFELLYIDAFAGTGYRSLRQANADGSDELLFPELAEPETQRFLAGSTRIALEIEPPFSTYIFIEKDPASFAELSKLREEYSSKRNEIWLVNEDANVYVQRLCRTRWAGRRAVLFLDPYGMQVGWETVEAIARTQAIDLWYLFPLGVAVNRLVRRDGVVGDSERRGLDRVFGATDWDDAFYERTTRPTLFGEESFREKVATFDSIREYLITRLGAVFAGVAKNPLLLRNSRNVPIYMLCVAAGNEKGAPIALKIAQHILKG
jgi:three-Cys-motif partner protein